MLESRYTTDVLTPAYLSSNFTEFENVIAQQLGFESLGIAEVADVVAGDWSHVVGGLSSGRDILHARDRVSYAVFLIKKEWVCNVVENLGRGESRQ